MPYAAQFVKPLKAFWAIHIKLTCHFITVPLKLFSCKTCIVGFVLFIGSTDYIRNKKYCKPYFYYTTQFQQLPDV